jgi:hypothetical protein
MAAEPNELSYIDFGPELLYNWEMVSRDVIWPLVDNKWGKNWQRQSHEGCELKIGHRVRRAGRLLVAELEADCSDWGDDGEVDLVRSATVYLEEEIENTGRSMFLQAARISAETLQEEIDSSQVFDDDEGDNDYSWPEGDEGDFGLRRGLAFMVTDGEEFSTEAYRVIDAPDVELSIPILDGEIDGAGTSEGHLRPHDLEVLQTACQVLMAPRFIAKALERVRSRPIEVL